MQDWKKIFIKMSRKKDTDKIQRAKKKLEGLYLFLIGINSVVIINNSFCWYYKNLRAKCKKLWLDKFIHGFETFNGSIRLKPTEMCNVSVIKHDSDMEQPLSGN